MNNNAIFLGNINGEKFHDGYAGAVFSINGISPNITTCQGGGRQPHIIIVSNERKNNKIGMYRND